MINCLLHQKGLVNIKANSLFADIVQIDQFPPILNRNPFCKMFTFQCQHYVNDLFAYILFAYACEEFFGKILLAIIGKKGQNMQRKQRFYYLCI